MDLICHQGFSTRAQLGLDAGENAAYALDDIKQIGAGRHLNAEIYRTFAVEADGRTISATVDGVQVAARDDTDKALIDGGVAIIIQGGAASTDEVLVAPPRAGASAPSSRALVA